MFFFYLFIYLFITKIGYYKDNKSKLLKKAHEKYHNGGGKEKAALYYQKKNKKWIKERQRDRHKLMTVEKRKAKIQKSMERYYRLKKLNIKNE